MDLAGSFSKEPEIEQKTFKIGTGWTQIKMDSAVPASPGQLAVTFTVPEGTTVFADAFTFRAVK